MVGVLKKNKQLKKIKRFIIFTVMTHYSDTFDIILLKINACTPFQPILFRIRSQYLTLTRLKDSPVGPFWTQRFVFSSERVFKHFLGPILIILGRFSIFENVNWQFSFVLWSISWKKLPTYSKFFLKIFPIGRILINAEFFFDNFLKKYFF